MTSTSRSAPARSDCRQMVNVGCGLRTHGDWINIDWSPKLRLSRLPFLGRLVGAPPGIWIYDVRRGLPFGAATVDVVYASHVLEHLQRQEGRRLLEEAHRVLKPAGTVRIVVPDLEIAVRRYLEALVAVRDGVRDKGGLERYEWATILLLDQMVRTASGGEMVRWLEDHPQSAVVGSFEGTLKDIAACASRGGRRSGLSRRLVAALRPDPRSSGELHRWMYDSFSLRELLEGAGFCAVRSVSHLASRIEGWTDFHLDNNTDSRPHQPDSIWMEGTKEERTLLPTAGADL